MILALRKRHRRIFMALAVFLPIIFVVGLAARKPIPVMIAPVLESTRTFSAVKWENSGLFDATPIKVQTLRETENTGPFALKLSTAQAPVKPDVLVYWIPDAITTNTLPPNALLLGAFGSTVTLPMPRSIAAGQGSLVLYSLADQQVVAASKLFRFPGP